MKYYSYETFKNDTNKLIAQIEKPDVIVAIARGGMILAHTMAEGFDVRDVQMIRTELYDEQTKRDLISFFGECELSHAKNVLVVDDIADSGETLAAVMKHLESRFCDVEFTTATLFYKETSCYEPDHWINIADDWIDFFWERDFKQ